MDPADFKPNAKTKEVAEIFEKTNEFGKLVETCVALKESFNDTYNLWNVRRPGYTHQLVLQRRDSLLNAVRQCNAMINAITILVQEYSINFPSVCDVETINAHLQETVEKFMQAFVKCRRTQVALAHLHKIENETREELDVFD